MGRDESLISGEDIVDFGWRALGDCLVNPSREGDIGCGSKSICLDLIAAGPAFGGR